MRANTAKAFIRGTDLIKKFVSPLRVSTLTSMPTVSLLDSVEGDGDVLWGSGARKTRHAEGALLQVAL